MQEQNEILRELESMGSSLAAMPRSMPYSVPGSYFKDFPAQVLMQAQETISALPKLNPYSVPEGYFDQLPVELLAAIKEEDRSGTRVIPLKRDIWKQFRFAAAAIFLLAAGAGIFQLAMPKDSIDSRLAALPDDALREYVTQHTTELPVENAVVTGTELPGQLTEEEIKQYLDETGWQ